MKSNVFDQFALHEYLLDFYIADGSYHAAESFAIARRICEQFELDVSHSDILDTIYSVELHMEDYWSTEDMDQVPF